MYGLKQAPRAWYTRIDSYFTGLGFTKSEADENLYHIVVEGKILIIVHYVDDLILIGDEQLIHSCKANLAKEFEMRDLGLLHVVASNNPPSYLVLLLIPNKWGPLVINTKN